MPATAGPGKMSRHIRRPARGFLVSPSGDCLARVAVYGGHS
jgi:hypothetical protein